MNNKEVITLLDEQGKEVEFTLLTVVEVGANRYAVLLPMEVETGEEEESDVEVVVMRQEGEELILVESDEELNQVLQYIEENGVLDEFLQ